MGKGEQVNISDVTNGGDEAIQSGIPYRIADFRPTFGRFGVTNYEVLSA